MALIPMMNNMQGTQVAVLINWRN